MKMKSGRNYQGSNRAQQRASARRKSASGSEKPLFMRILVIGMVAALFLGFFLAAFL